MEEVYSNNYLKINKNNRTSIFTIELSVSNNILIDSLIKTKIIQGGTSTDDYKSIKFKAQSVKSLDNFIEEHSKRTGSKSLPISVIVDMTVSLVSQLKYLIIKYFHTILGYNKKNIIVINDARFVFVGSEYITEIEENMVALISSPFATNDFYLSPELLKIKEIPSYIHFKTAYFSLGCLLINGLLSNDDFYEEYLKHEQSSKIMESLYNHPIKGTKLYWLLSRCLVEEPENRSITLI